MRFIFLLIFLFIFCKYNSQVTKLNYIELLYDQGHYKNVFKKSKRLLNKESIQNKNSILLFYSLSEYMLSKEKRKYSNESAIDNYKKICAIDTNFYIRNMYNNYINDLRYGMIEKIITLHTKGNKKQSKKHFNLFNELFNVKDLTYEKILNKEITTINIRDNIIDYAKNHIGIPYKYGGTDKKGFDCSGFTQYVLSNFGYSIPRTASNQAVKLKKIKISQIQKGDLIFFGKNNNNISHVGIVVNEKGAAIKMIHASSSKGIIISNVTNNKYWEPKLQMAAKIID